MTQTHDDLLQALFTFLIQHFNDSELNTLCFRLGIQYEDLPGTSRSDKARELVSYCQRHGWIPSLLQELERQRPQPFKNAGLQLPTGKPILSPFPANLSGEAAYPIAVACNAFNQAAADDAVSQFISLDRLIENLIKYLVAVTLTHYWRAQPDKGLLRTWLGKLSLPSLSAWLEVWDEIGDGYSNDSAPPRLIPHLYDRYHAPVAADSSITTAYAFILGQLAAAQIAVGEAPLTIGVFLRQLLCYRHLEWEGRAGQFDAEMRDALLPLLQPALQEILSSLPIITQYNLQYIERADPVGGEWIYTRLSFQGNKELPTMLPPLQMPVVEGDPAYRPRRLYLCDTAGTPLLNLHPMLIAYPNPLIKLYFFDYKADNQEIRFLHCGSSKRVTPPVYIKTLRESMFDLGKESDEADQDPVAFLNDTEYKIEEAAVSSAVPADLSLAVLLSHLSAEGREALEIGLGEALRIGRFWLGVEFLLMGLSKQRGRPFPILLREIGCHPGDFRGVLRGLMRTIDKDWRELDPQILGAKELPHIQIASPDHLAKQKAATGGYPTVMTPRVLAILRTAYELTGEKQIGHRHLLAATLRHYKVPAIQALLRLAYEAEWSPTQLLARAETLINMEPEDLAASAERDDQTPNRPLRMAQQRPAPPPGGSVLAKMGRNLTQAASEGKLGEAYGENAHQALIEMGRVLLKKEGNNPIILGEAGVGKTAVVEGFAWRLAGHGKGVIPQLQGKQIIQISAADLTAGTKYRGDLEEQLKQLVSEVKEADGQIIIFIDEIHTILSSDSASGLSMITETLKPALARGEFPCIGATTVAEYRRYIEKDPALARRFTPVWLEEPTIEDATQIVTHVAQTRLSEHHGGVKFTTKGIETAVNLTARYLHDERLPGKAIKVLDEAASSLIMGGSLSGDPTDMPMVSGGQVNSEIVTRIVAAHTNIPAEQLAKSNKQRLRELEDKLKAQIIGQDDAVDRVVRVLKRAGAGFGNDKRPLGVFLFTGPTGVGKTELALALAKALFDNEDAIFRLDMSEFMEKHQVSRLIGAPPGYIRSDEEGQLTGLLRRRPYSVVLLDEMEKAHEDVQHLFLQLFDNGRLTDNHGNVADGRNAIFIMTTNLGAREMMGFGQTPTYREKLKTALYDHFSPEFMNRLDRIVYFEPLGEEALVAIFDKEFEPFQKRFGEQGIRVEIPETVKQKIVHDVAKQKMGARPLQRVIEDQIVTPLIDKLLDEEAPTGTIHVGKDIEVRAMTLSPWANLPPLQPSPISPLPQFDLGNLNLEPIKEQSTPASAPLSPLPESEEGSDIEEEE